MKALVELIPVGEWKTTLDMFERKYWAPYKRAAIIHGMAITGSAALGDTGAQLKQGEEVMAELLISKLGATAVAVIEIYPHHYVKMGAVRKGKEWSLFPVADATNNGVYLYVWLTE